MNDTKYEGLGKEWLLPILKLDQQMAMNKPTQEKEAPSTRCDQTLDMFEELEKKR